MQIEIDEQSDGSVQVMLDEKPLTCPACGNQLFIERGFLLNTRSGEFFGLAWADDKASNFVCNRCGYIFWFLLIDVTRTKPDHPPEPLLDRVFGKDSTRTP
jgi:predicted RNA-binding Zn-ribbon protein involved in translation (DUF1610 family)